MSQFDQLHGFLMVGETGSVSAAARKLGISQPALSRRLQQLENQIGLKLLIRRKHGIELTESGSRLAADLGPLYSALDERLNTLTQRRSVRPGKLAIGSISEIGRSFVYPRLLGLSQEIPHCRFEVHLLRGKEIVEGIFKGTLDLGVVIALPDSPNLVAQMLFEEKSILVTRAGNVRDITNVTEAVSSSFVSYRKDDPLLIDFLSQIAPRARAERIEPRFVINDHRALLELLLATDSYAVMPIHAVSGALDSGALRKAALQQVSNRVWGVRLKSNTNALIKAGLARLRSLES